MKVNLRTSTGNSFEFEWPKYLELTTLDFTTAYDFLLPSGNFLHIHGSKIDYIIEQK